MPQKPYNAASKDPKQTPQMRILQSVPSRLTCNATGITKSQLIQ